MSDTPPSPASLQLPAPSGTGRRGTAAPLRLDLGLHGVPGLVGPGESPAGPLIEGEAVAPGAVLTRADAALMSRLFRRRAPLALSHQGRALRCVLLPAAAAPGGEGPWLGLTVAGHPAALRIGWALARRLAGVTLEAASAEDAALLLEDALTPWLDAAEDLLGLELRFDRLERGAALPAGPRLALGVEATGEDIPAARQILPLQLGSGAAQALATSLDRWLRPRDVLDGLVLRAAVEVEATRLAVGDLESLQVGDALLIDGAGGGTPRIVVEEQLVAAAEPAQPAAPGGQVAWRLLSGFAPRGPMRVGAPAGTEERMAENDDTVAGGLAGGGPAAPPEAAGDRPSDQSGAGGTPAEAAPAADEVVAAPQPSPGQQPGAAPSGGPTSLPSLDRLEVRLSIRMGETMMTLAELRQAGPGTILTLDRPDGALVDIVANGQPIGTGEIISVSGQRAVEIRTLFGDG